MLRWPQLGAHAVSMLHTLLSNGVACSVIRGAVFRRMKTLQVPAAARPKGETALLFEDVEQRIAKYLYSTAVAAGGAGFRRRVQPDDFVLQPAIPSATGGQLRHGKSLVRSS